jgi:hypothetical protein
MEEGKQQQGTSNKLNNAVCERVCVYETMNIKQCSVNTYMYKICVIPYSIIRFVIQHRDTYY